VLATAETIWQVPAYLPYLQPPLTNQVIEAAEGQLGHKLPGEYLNLLEKQNGGYIRFSLPKLPHNVIAGIGPNFPSLTGFDWEECRDYVSVPLDGLVPFDGDGHWHLCLDYRRNQQTPSITYVDIESDRELAIADSFGSYLCLLSVSDEDEYVVDDTARFEQLKARLSSSLGAAFEPPDTWAHGYPTHRARLGTESGPEWIWISPNSVPRSFVRPNDPRYGELKDLLPGYGLRFPEVPPEAYLLSATEGVRTRVLEVCRSIQPVVRPLREYLNSI